MSATGPLHELTAVALRAALAAGETTALEATEHALRRAERHNDRLRAFTTLTAERARERAAALDLARRQGDGAANDLRAAPLWGLPLADKDLTDRAGVPTSFGSRVFAARPALSDSRLVSDLDGSGAVSIGKTNTPEFGLSCATTNLLGGPARNPWDEDRSPGGSSGGAAVAVAAGLLPAAPGSDGGGSIRIPAAATGLVGLKPSRGRVRGGAGIESLAGLIVAGPLARTVEDAALLLDGIRGAHAPWPYMLRAPAGPESYLAALQQPAPTSRLRIGVSTWSPWQDGESAGIEVAASHLDALEQTAAALARAGHEIVRIPLPGDPGADGAEGVVHAPGYARAFRAIWQAGAASLPLGEEELELVEPLTAWLVRQGRRQGAGTLARSLAWLAAFESQVVLAYRGFDAVLTPTVAFPPPSIDWYDRQDGERNFAQQVRYAPFTSYVNVTGLPAIALPVVTDADLLPVSVQAIGRPGEEELLLRLGLELQRQFGWAVRRAPGWRDA